MRPEKKIPVENCYTLSVSVLSKKTLRFSHKGVKVLILKTKGRAKSIPMRYQIFQDGDLPVIQFEYVAKGQQVTSVLRLQVTRPHWGGIRYWFTCFSCKEKVGILYLPPEQKEFSCRKCHRLTYLSTQKPFVSRLREFSRALEMLQHDLDSKELYKRIAATGGARVLVSNFLKSSMS